MPLSAMSSVAGGKKKILTLQLRAYFFVIFLLHLFSSYIIVESTSRSLITCRPEGASFEKSATSLTLTSNVRLGLPLGPPQEIEGEHEPKQEEHQTSE
jgi:hypothetical protein